MYRILIPHNMCWLISLCAWLGLFVCDMQGICGFKASSIFNAWGWLHSPQNGEVEEQGGKLFVQHYPESPWGSRKGNPHYRPLVQFPLPHREQCCCHSEACGHIFVLLHTCKCIFWRHHFMGLSPPPSNLYLVLKTKVCLTQIEIKRGGQTVGAWKGAKDLKEVALEKLQENLWPWSPWREGVLTPMMTELNYNINASKYLLPGSRWHAKLLCRLTT